MISRATLDLGAVGGATRLLRAEAHAPQRWTIGAVAPPWSTIYHQLLGDGCFPGEAVVTRYRVRPLARALVNAVAATPLRRGAPSRSVTEVRVDPGGVLILRSGALLPHAGAVHRSLLRMQVATGGCLAHLQAIAPGRSAHEVGRFALLEFRTRLIAGQELVLREDVVIDPNDWPPGDPVVVAVTAAGPWPPAEPDWWRDRLRPWPTAAAWPLRDGRAVLARALVPTLGEANALIGSLMDSLRAAAPPDICCSRSRKKLDTHP